MNELLARNETLKIVEPALIFTVKDAAGAGLKKNFIAAMYRQGHQRAGRAHLPGFGFINPNFSTCPRRNANCHLNTETWAVMLPKATFPTLPSHEGPAADACTLVDNTRQTAWTWRGQGYRRRQPSYETATPYH